MYIAFKWLLLMAISMWFTLCWKDFVRKANEIRVDNSTDFYLNQISSLMFKNIMNLSTVDKIPARKEIGKKDRSKLSPQNDITMLHYVTFFAGALVVTVFNRKNEIFSYTKRKLSTFNTKLIRKCLKHVHSSLNKTAIVFRVSITKNARNAWEILTELLFRLQHKLNLETNRSKLNVLLIKKLKEIMEERNNLGRLLVSAIQANKNIRMQHQLETMAKNRLVRHIEDTQKQIKENRSRYVNFQQLYIMTHQENIFLKARITKLSNEKEEAEKNLTKLMNEIYISKNKDLKNYCNRFIVQNKDHLLCSGVSEEIQKFFKKARCPTASTSNWQIGKEPNISVNLTKSWPSTRVTEIIPDEEGLVVLNTDEPKLKGLPGEYVWTVKDKNGIIEKLYEYDYGYNFESVDTISRIREYSVYHDKDCLLDFSNSKTLLSKKSCDSFQPQLHLDFPTRQRFLTDSEPFQKFLKDNKNIVTSTPQAPPVLSG